MKFFFPLLAIGLCTLLGGCNTLGTLASQFGETPLPPRVAKQLYGLCRDCTRNGAVPGCETCIIVQQKRRMLAGTPARQITPELEAFVRNEEPGIFQGLFPESPAPRKAVWLREKPEPPRRKTASTYSKVAANTGSEPLPNPTPTPKPKPAYSYQDSPPMPDSASRSKRKPDGYDALGYGRKENK